MAAEEVKFIFSMDDMFSKQAKQAEASVNSLEKGINRIATSVVAAFSVGQIVSFEKSIVESFGKMEMFKTSLTTMLHGNAEEAEALNRQLINLAKTTPFELTEVQDATRQLIAFGSEAGGVEKELRTLGNVASGIGSPISSIAYLYGTIRTQGRAMTVDINQFANRGIPVWKELEKITGKSGLALRKYVEDGKVGFKEIQGVFNNLTKEGGQFYNLMENQSKTVTGQISNLSDAWQQLKITLGESQSGMIKSTLSWSTDLVNDIQTVWAAENKLEKRLSQGGAEGFGFFSKRFHQDEYDALLAMSDMWDENIKKASDSEAQLHRLKQQTAEGILSLIDQRAKGTIDEEEYKRLSAITKGAQSDIQGSLDLLKSKRLSEKTPASETIKKENDKVKGQHYTNITINIDQIHGIEKAEFKTVHEAGISAGEEITKFLVKGITDSQIAAGQ